jgi:hypothetical protein
MACEDLTAKCTECAPATNEGSFFLGLEDNTICEFEPYAPTCSENHYLSPNSVCVECGANCLRCSDVSGACEECAAGTVVDATNMACFAE